MADDPAAAPPGSRATLAALGVIAFCGLLGEGAAGDWSAVYLHEDLGTSPAYATLGFAAFAVTMTVGRLLGDRLAARFGPVRLVRGCALLAAAGLATGLLSGVPAAAVAGFGLLGAGLSCIVPQAFSAAGNIDPGRAGRNIARVAGIGYLGLLGGPVLIGALATWLDLPRALWLPVVLALVMAGFAGAMRRAAGGWRRSGGEPRVR